MGRPERSPVRRLALARLISFVGSAAADIAAAYVIYQRTHSAYWLSALFLLTFGVNGLLSPFFGALADRHDRRRIMIASDLVGAACFVALIPIKAPAAMIALVFVASLAATPFATASGVAIPNLAPEGELAWANSLLSMSGWTGRVLAWRSPGPLRRPPGRGCDRRSCVLRPRGRYARGHAQRSPLAERVRGCVPFGGPDDRAGC